MTARSRKRRDKNKKLKGDKRKNKELDRIRKQMGIPDEDAKSFLQKVKDITNGVDAESIKRQKDKDMEQIREQFLEETTQTVANAPTIEITQEKSGVKHVYNTKTMRDQFGNYPAWYHVNNMKKKIKKRKSTIRNKHNLTWKGTMLPL